MTIENKIQKIKQNIKELKRLRKQAEGYRDFREADQYYWKIIIAEVRLAELEELRDQSKGE